jgi:hypothetical protein
LISRQSGRCGGLEWFVRSGLFRSRRLPRLSSGDCLVGRPLCCWSMGAFSAAAVGSDDGDSARGAEPPREAQECSIDVSSQIHSELRRLFLSFAPTGRTLLPRIRWRQRCKEFSFSNRSLRRSRPATTSTIALWTDILCERAPPEAGRWHSQKRADWRRSRSTIRNASRRLRGRQALPEAKRKRASAENGLIKSRASLRSCRSRDSESPYRFTGSPPNHCLSRSHSRRDCGRARPASPLSAALRRSLVAGSRIRRRHCIAPVAIERRGRRAETNVQLQK